MLFLLKISIFFLLISYISCIKFVNRTKKSLEKNQTEFSAFGIRVEDGAKEVEYEDGIVVVPAHRLVRLRIFGHGFTNTTILRFVSENGEFGSDCDDLPSTKIFYLEPGNNEAHSALSQIILPPLDSLVGQDAYYLCLRDNSTDDPWIHQGSSKLLMLKTSVPLLPLWSMILGIIILLLLAAVFSGLNLGLMALDHTELKIIAATGTAKEKRYAKLIQPLRNRGNYLLCTLLLGNVMVNSLLTILLDEIAGGLVAVVGATLSIVILGEIIPQAICSRNGLAIGARTVWLTKIFMILTFPIAYPVSVILDKALGEEIGNVYNSARLKELLKITHGQTDLGNDEENIISGALELKSKTVMDVMIKLDKVFMLPVDACLDFDTISEIMSQGYSRIPVYEKHRHQVVSILYTKDLAFVDPEDKMPLKVICEFRKNPIMFVSETTMLDIVFRNFKAGLMGHMAMVQAEDDNTNASNNNTEVIGIVTLEDIIEELIQAEIEDEKDISRVNKSRRKSKSLLSIVPSVEAMRWRSDGVIISSQLSWAAYQYLSTSIDEFKEDKISKRILQKLLSQDLYFEIKTENKIPGTETSIYEKGKPADYFVLILEGRVKSEMGKEKLVFESGPFTFYGIQSLADTELTTDGEKDKNPCTKFIPDYTVRAITDVTFLRISRSIYVEARMGTLLDKTSHPHHRVTFEKSLQDTNTGEVDDVKKAENTVTSEDKKLAFTYESMPDPQSLMKLKEKLKGYQVRRRNTTNTLFETNNADSNDESTMKKPNLLPSITNTTISPINEPNSSNDDKNLEKHESNLNNC